MEWPLFRIVKWPVTFNKGMKRSRIESPGSSRLTCSPAQKWTLRRWNCHQLLSCKIKYSVRVLHCGSNEKNKQHFFWNQNICPIGFQTPKPRVGSMTGTPKNICTYQNTVHLSWGMTGRLGRSLLFQLSHEKTHFFLTFHCWILVCLMMGGPYFPWVYEIIPKKTG